MAITLILQLVSLAIEMYIMIKLLYQIKIYNTEHRADILI